MLDCHEPCAQVFVPGFRDNVDRKTHSRPLGALRGRLYPRFVAQAATGRSRAKLVRQDPLRLLIIGASEGPAATGRTGACARPRVTAFLRDPARLPPAPKASDRAGRCARPRLTRARGARAERGPVCARAQEISRPFAHSLRGDSQRSARDDECRGATLHLREFARRRSTAGRGGVLQPFRLPDHLPFMRGTNCVRKS